MSVNFDFNAARDAFLANALTAVTAKPSIDPFENEAPEPTLLDYALDCVRRGWYVFPCYPRSKAPAGEVVPHGVNEATNDEAVVREWWERNPSYNPAIALGPSNLVVYDFDSIAPFAELPATFTVQTGRIPMDGIAGIQKYFVGSCKTHGHTGGGGEVRSRGAYVMATGAVHPSGNRYFVIDDRPLSASPEQNTEEIRQTGPAIGTDDQNTIAQYVEAAFDDADIKYRNRTASSEGGFKWLVICPWKSEHTSGKDFDSSSAVMMMPSGMLIYCCKHAHCDNLRQWKELRAWMEDKVGHRLTFGDPQPSNLLVTGRVIETEAIAVTENETPGHKTPSYLTMPESAMASTRLGDIYANQFAANDFPLDMALPALVTAASVLVPRIVPAAGTLVVGDDAMVNLYTAIIGPLGVGKSQVNEWAAKAIGVWHEETGKHYAEGKFGSAEQLMMYIKRRLNLFEGSVLINPDEWAHLFSKAGIPNASFPTVLTTGYYKRRQSMTVRGAEIDINLALSFTGGVVEDDFGTVFGSGSLGGLYDRFLFGLAPAGFSWDYRPYPFTSQALKPEPVAVKQDGSVYEVIRAWNKQDRTLGRVTEICARVATIYAAFDGRSVVTGADLEKLWGLAQYQASVRARFKPNGGENPDAVFTNAVLSWLTARPRQWFNIKALKDGVHAYEMRLGPNVAERALSAMCRTGQIDLWQTKMGQPLPGDWTGSKPRIGLVRLAN
jgi:hypothetical protein